MDLEHETEKGRGVVRPGKPQPPAVIRPKLGGRVALPGVGGATQVFSLNVFDLPVAERAAPGWVIRMGIPSSEALPDGTEYDLRPLMAEVTFVSGGTEQMIEVDAGTPFSLHVAAEQVSARLRYVSEVPDVPPAFVNWQVSRGVCRTTASRSFHIEEDGDGYAHIPNYADRFGLFSPGGTLVAPDALAAANASLTLRVQYEGLVLHEYVAEDLIALLGSSTRVPPGARHWEWHTTMQSPIQIAFFYGEVGA